MGNGVDCDLKTSGTAEATAAAMNTAVLRSVLRLVDQSTRVTCCRSSKKLCETLKEPGLWPSVIVHKPTQGAAEFIGKVQSTTVTVLATNVTEVESFFESLNAPLTRVCIAIGEPSLFPRSCRLGQAIARFQDLEELIIECGTVRRTTGIVFDTDMPKLRVLRVTEESASRRVEVYFQAKFPDLDDVYLRVFTSDVLACMRTTMPSLCHLRYEAESDLYEDANMEGITLAAVQVHTGNSVAWTYLSSALARASAIRRLTLVCSDASLHIDNSLPVRDLCVRVAGKVSTSVVVTLNSARVLESLVVLHAGGGEGWTVRFVECGSWERFLAFLRNTEVYVGRWGAHVTIEF